MTGLKHTLRGCNRFIFTGNAVKSSFQKGKCTHAWADFVLSVGIATCLIFHRIKNNDKPFSEGYRYFFCT